MNGVDISRHVRKVDIHAEVDKATTIALEFIAVDVSALGDLAREYALSDAD